MNQPPELITLQSDWATYEEIIYTAFLDSFVRPVVKFQGLRVSAQFRPETRGKGFSFWHTISKSPDKDNHNEEDRIPDLRCCERILWIRWVIDNAGKDGFPWWENRRKRNTNVVIWAHQHDFVVVLGKRRNYFVLKTAYTGLQPHRRRKFERERQAFWEARKAEAP